MNPTMIATPASLVGAAFDYTIDAWQRTLLLWDVLRQRGDQYREHLALEAPNVLAFVGEVIVDGRTLPRPVNYQLFRIAPPDGVVTREGNRPFVVIDPRAGHGPGIGGFKADSEIGVALRAGHPCYFIGFRPAPEPGQTVEDVIDAIGHFVDDVVRRHPLAVDKPCVIGNCQAGWALMMSAARTPARYGPLILAGAPLSYWQGWRGRNPMRYMGGLVGGSWLTALLGDLGDGRFDGAWLVGNFERLDPANTLWKKLYALWADVDHEAPRYLGFERWWGGHVELAAQEIQTIVDDLFVGNRLATAELTTRDGEPIDLRHVSAPIVCFCSNGDNITPPPQALGWITDLYDDVDDIVAHGQTIVYAVHEHTGHLGIFVSSAVARKEHEEFVSNIDFIDVLPPGLYEAVLIPREGAEPAWTARFERRSIDDVRAIVQFDAADERRFATVRRVSEFNLGIYRAFVQPWVRAVSNAWLARWLWRANPTRVPYELWNDQAPWADAIARLAAQVREQRKPVADDNPFVVWQTALSNGVVATLDAYRDVRDDAYENAFMLTYGLPWLQAWAGVSIDRPPRRKPARERAAQAALEASRAALRARIGDGGTHEAAIRALMYLALGTRGGDERAFEALRRIHREHAPDESLPVFKAKLREQYLMLLVDETAALDALPAMLDKPDHGARILEGLRAITAAVGDPTPAIAQRLQRLSQLFEVRSAAAAPRVRNTSRRARDRS